MIQFKICNHTLERLLTCPKVKGNFQRRHPRRLIIISEGAIESYAFWAVVVVQLAERSLLIPEVCSSNPVICEIL